MGCTKAKAKCFLGGVRSGAESVPPTVGAGGDSEWLEEMRGLMKSMAKSLAEIPPLLKSVKAAVDELRFVGEAEEWAKDEKYEFAPVEEAELEEMESGIASLAEESEEYKEWYRRKWMATPDREEEDRKRKGEESVAEGEKI